MRTTTRFVICLLLAFVLSGCAQICNGGWTKVDTTLELADQGLIVADWRQTQRIVEQPTRFAEMNPILHPHPSMARLNIYMALWVPIHAGISCIAPQPYRRVWQVGTLLVEVPTVYNNHQIGLGW